MPRPDLIAVYMPSLGSMLLRREDAKGEPLTEKEVLAIRDGATCVMMPVDQVKKLEEKRGPDVDPENCWYDFQHLRRSLGRHPDIDPGPSKKTTLGGA